MPKNVQYSFCYLGHVVLRKTPFVILHHNIELQNLQTFAPKKKITLWEAI
jgi:hypothetical protein